MPSFRTLALLVSAVFLPLFADNHVLSFQPIAAEYNQDLDRIIFIASNPPRVVIYDPAGRTTQDIPLQAEPLNLSVSQEGAFAAVRHAAKVSYVNLRTRNVEGFFDAPAPPEYLNGALPPIVLSQYMIHLPPYYSIRNSDGQLWNGGTPASNATESYQSRLQPGGRFLYSVRARSANAAVFTKSEVNNGAITSTFVPRDQPAMSTLTCAPFYFNRDGSRIFTSCNGGPVYAASTNPNEDIQWIANLLADSSDTIEGVAEAADGTLAAAVTHAGNYTIQLFNGPYLKPAGTLWPLSGTSANRPRWIFFNRDGNALYSVMRSDSGNVYSTQTYDIGNRAGCMAPFADASATVSGSGGFGRAVVFSNPECLFRATTDVSWLRILSGGTGTGVTSLMYQARRNTSGASRTGNIVIGSQRFTVTQPAAPAPGAESVAQLDIQVADAAWNKSNDTLVLASAISDEIEIYNPATGSVTPIDLVRRPTAVALSPDGRFAAVAHDGWISYVNLQTNTVERVFKAPAKPEDVALPGNGFVYTNPAGAGGGLSYANLSGSAQSLTHEASRAYIGGSIAVHPSGKSIYVSNSKWSVENGAPSNPNYGVSFTGSKLWMAEDGNRLMDQTGRVYRLSDDPTQDGKLIHQFSEYTDPAPVTWADQSSRQQATALLLNGRNEVVIHRDADFSVQMRSSLPDTGKFLFWTRNGARLYAILESGVYEVPNVNCTFSISPASALDAGWQGGSGELTVTTQPGCNWNIGPANYIFSFTGATEGRTGTGTLPYTISPNLSKNPLRGSLLINSQSFPVFQAGNPATFSVSPAVADVPQAGGSGFLTVTPSNQSILWSVSQTFSPWATAFGTAEGTGRINYQVEPLPSGVPQRTVSFYFEGQLLTIRQSGDAGPVASPGATSLPANGGTATVNITSTSPDRWSAVVSSLHTSWLSITGGQSTATGNASFTIAAAPNRSNTPRQGLIQIGQANYTVFQAAQTELVFYPVRPCRLADTRSTSVAEAQSTRDFQVSNNAAGCGVPANAAAYSLNVTVVPRGSLGYLTIYPRGGERPVVSLLNSLDGRIKANAAMVPAGTNGDVSVFVTNRTDVVLDITGYFAPPSITGLQFFPVTPCRIADSRGTGTYAAGGTLRASAPRTVSIPAGTCGLPNAVAAYALNVTAIPKATLGYLTLWPTGQTMPTVSTLNALTGAITANTALAPAGVDGSIDLFASNDTEFLLDVSGYFAPLEGFGRPLSFFSVPPCRAADTRTQPQGALNLDRVFNAISEPCSIPQDSMAVAVNATVVPSGPVGYLTLWAPGNPQPVVSTLNALDGALTSNTAIAPVTQGSFQAFVSSSSHAFFDITGFFAMPKP